MRTRTPKPCDLTKAFFPVEEQSDIWCEYNGRSLRIPGYKAIIDKDARRTLSVVSSKYRLVTNLEAFQIADYVVRTVFEGKKLDDFECYNILMPQTKGSCRIDMIIPNNFNKLFGDNKESWTPFVRISNSYNRTMTLRYEIGFCRWICLNGVIFGQTGISFSITHTGRITHREIDQLVRSAQAQIGSIGSLWAAFEEKMKQLKDIALPLSSALAIYCKVFGIIVKEDTVSETQKDNLASRAIQIVEASREYFDEMGNNAYAMMNVMSDFASFPEWTPSPSQYVDGYQRKVGKWVDSFLEERHKPDFNLDTYIGDDYQNTAFFLETLVSGSKIQL